jgi:hypothetical protein
MRQSIFECNTGLKIKAIIQALHKCSSTGGAANIITPANLLKMTQHV